MKKDIVVGIPTKNEEATIIHVLGRVAGGLYEHFPGYKSLIVIADGNSTDRTLHLAKEFRTPTGVAKKIIKHGCVGKGNGVRRIMEVCKEVEGECLALVDSDLISITPPWVDRLVRPIVYGVAEFTTPRYIRDKHDGGITKLFTYPVLSALFGDIVRQPLAGEIALCRELIEECLKIPLFPSDWGVDTFITFTALVHNARVHETPLGPKFHESTSKYLRPEAHLLPMFEQAAIALFNLMEHYREKWKKPDRVFVGRVRRFDRYHGAKPTPTVISRADFRASARKILKQQEAKVEKVLGEKPKSIINKLTFDRWPEYVFKIALKYKRTKDNNLIKLLSGLWLGRYANFVDETKQMNLDEAERLVHKQMLAFLTKKPMLEFY